MEEMLMPLHKYLDAPTAHDIIHNGATFQIAGLTNNSHLSEAHEVRHCVQKFKSLGESVLQVAKVVTLLLHHSSLRLGIVLLKAADSVSFFKFCRGG
jgi:hypothetical protein